MSRTFPDFLIVGAPKSGTTSLHRYLMQHPGVFFPSGKKEPVFFCGYAPRFEGPGSESLNLSMVTDPGEYEALYSGAEPGSITGDASTDYLSCQVAAERIRQWNPDARIIVVLRNPVDRAYSEHMHVVRDQFETLSFGEALALEDERREKGYIPLFWHKARGLYYDSVKRYLDIFGESRVKVILYDDFTQDTRLVVGDIFQFIGLSPENVQLSKRYNVSGAPKWPLLQSLYIRFRQASNDGLAKRAVRVLSSQRVRRGLRNAYLRIGLRKGRGPTLQDREFLADYYRNDIVRLSGLIGRDLSHWLSDKEA